jgi:protein-disulfide isomerase
MRKLILLSVCVLFVFGCARQAVDVNTMDSKIKMYVESTLGDIRGVDIDRLAQVDDSDYYLYRLGNSVDEQYFFFNGKYLVTDFLDIDTKASKVEDMLFDMMNYSFDVSGLSLAYGKPDAKNIIIEITDYECPYCRRAYLYLEEKTRSRDDVAIYIVHLPLKIHEKAEISARIFEAGLLMGYNFDGELATSDAVLDYSPDELAEYFANKTNDADRFKKLLYSDEVNTKLQISRKLVDEHEFSSTPSFVINGKKITGFNTRLIDKALGL